MYIWEMSLSIVFASLLGWFVGYRWKSETAKWVWTFGACYLAWRTGVRFAPMYVPDWDLGEPVNNDAAENDLGGGSRAYRRVLVGSVACGQTEVPTSDVETVKACCKVMPAESS